MNKTHFFRAYFPQMADFDEDDMLAILKTCQEREFVGWPGHGDTTILVQEMLSSDHHSTVMMWRGSQCFGVEASCHYGAERVPSIAFAVARSLLWEGAPDKEELSRDLQNLFLRMCSELGARYGHFYSDLTAESIDDLSQVLTAVVAETMPHQLFWLNYFSVDYFRKLGIHNVRHLPGSLEPVGDNGMVITLSEHPWEPPVGPLDWREERPRKSRRRHRRQSPK